MSKNNMTNQNKIMLDGMEKIEVNPLDQPMYMPSKGKMSTPRDEVQATRDPMTIDYFKANFPSPTEADFPPAPTLIPYTGSLDISSMYATPIKAITLPIVKKPMQSFSDILKHFSTMEGEIKFLDYEANMNFFTGSESEFKSLADDISCPLCPMELYQKGPGKVATGIEEFDQMLDGGFRRGALTVIGAQAGIGKTRLLREFGTSMIKNGTPFVGSFYENLGDVLGEFNDASEVADQFEVVNGSCNLSTLIADLREVLDSIWAEVNEVPIVMVDDSTFYKDAGADTLANQLRRIAGEYNVAVVLTNPLSRQAHYSGDGVWLSSDTRLIASADAAITMTRADSTGWNKLKVVKNRDTGVLGQFTFFDPVSRAFSPF